MTVEEKCRGSDELYDNGYSRKTPVFALVPLSKTRLWTMEWSTFATSF